MSVPGAIPRSSGKEAQPALALRGAEDPGGRTAGGPPAEAGRPGIGGVARAMGWAAVEQWGRRLLGLLTFLVLARLLGPHEFGVVAMAALYVDFVQMFVFQGLPSALIQRKELTPAHLDTAFWCAMGSATVLAALSVVFRRPIAGALGDPSAGDVLAALAFGLLLAAAGAVPTALLTRDLAFRPLAIRAGVASGAGGLVGVAAAFRGAGVWALVLQHLVGAACGVACLWVRVAWRPGLRATRQALRDLWGFSLGVLGNHLLWVLSQRVDQAVVGRVLGARALGLYATAAHLPGVILQAVAGPPEAVALPAFSRMQDQRERLAAAFVRSTVLAGAVGWPLFAGLALVAPRALPALLGPKWAPAVVPFQAFSIVALASTTLMFVHPAFLALGRPAIYSLCYVVFAASRPAAALGAAGGGLGTLAWAVALAHILSGAVSAAVLHTLLPFSVSALARGLAPVAAATAALAAAVLALDPAWSGLPAPVALAAQGVAGACAYLGVLAWLAPGLRDDFLAALRTVALRGHRPQPVGTPAG